MRRNRRSVAWLCLGITALAVFLPGVWAFDAACFAPEWVLLPDDTPGEFVAPFANHDEQPLALRALLSSRGPPASFSL